MKSIQLTGSALNGAGEFCDGGTVLVIGKDIDADGAAALVKAQRAVAYAKPVPADVSAADAGASK